MPPPLWLDTVMVIVDDPPPAAIDAGLKLTVVPPGCPDADSAIGALSVPVTAALMVTVFELPREMLNDVGDAPIEKSPVAAEVTVSVTFTVSGVPLEGVPVTVML